MAARAFWDRLSGMRRRRRTLLARLFATGLLVAAGVLAGAGTAAPQLREEAQRPSEARSASGWGEGREIYAKVCGHCHDAGVAPVIRGRGLAPVVVRAFVRNGSRAMPAFRAAEIDDEALARLAEFVANN